MPAADHHRPDAAPDGGRTPWYAAWHERLYVRRRCRELLALVEALRTREPGLAGAALYGRLVMAATGGDESAAERELRRAEDNFARWPVARALSLRDVAHHLAVTEYLGRRAGRQAMSAELKRLVDDTIPGDL